MELIKAYKSSKTNDIISLYSTDSGTKKDAPAWINKSGNELIGIFDREGYYEIVMKKTK
jgi:TusA-related sulfurtransferase